MAHTMKIVFISWIAIVISVDSVKVSAALTAALKTDDGPLRYTFTSSL